MIKWIDVREIAEKLKEIQRSVNEKKLFNRKDEQFL